MTWTYDDGSWCAKLPGIDDGTFVIEADDEGATLKMGGDYEGTFSTVVEAFDAAQRLAAGFELWVAAEAA